MQALYALYQSKESNFELGLEEIADSFLPDLNSMEVQNHELLKRKKAEASVLYEKYFLDSTVPYTVEENDVVAAVENAKLNCKKRVEKDVRHFRKLMLEDVENINHKYIEILCFITELSKFVEVDEVEKKAKLVKTLPTVSKALKFKDNAMIKVLQENQSLEVERIKKKIVIEQAFVRVAFKEYLKIDEAYVAYQALDEAGLEEDRAICLHIVKQLILKKDAIVTHFESDDLNWTENSSIVKSMVSKTIKSLGTDSKGTDVLLEISTNWEEDKAYFLDLYDKTLEKDLELEPLITERVKNWEADRVALMDKIIMKLATVEMIIFPSIPVKVSINEFIEISKLYSTPKSKIFVNGVLDSIAAELTQKGVIRKSGRGLIDNK